MLVLVLEVVLNVLFDILLQRLALMEIASALSANHRNLGITATIDNLDCIPIGLSAISHESLELWQRYTVRISNLQQVLRLLLTCEGIQGVSKHKNSTITLRKWQRGYI